MISKHLPLPSGVFPIVFFFSFQDRCWSKSPSWPLANDGESCTWPFMLETVSNGRFLARRPLELVPVWSMLNDPRVPQAVVRTTPPDSLATTRCTGQVRGTIHSTDCHSSYCREDNFQSNSQKQPSVAAHFRPQSSAPQSDQIEACIFVWPEPIDAGVRMISTPSSIDQVFPALKAQQIGNSGVLVLR